MAENDFEVFVKVTYTVGKDRGVEVHLPVYPCHGDAWRRGVLA